MDSIHKNAYDQRHPSGILLTLHGGPMNGTSFRCRAGTPIQLGRDPSRANLVLTGYQTVSGLHCRAEFSNGKLTLTDLGSTNGTFVNKTRIPANQPVSIPDGAEIMLGSAECNFRVTYEYPSEATIAAPPIPTPRNDPPETDTKEESKEKKKPLLLILILVAVIAIALVISFTVCFHKWTEADCLTPKTCAKCDKTEGEALGHEWVDADCVAPKTCSRCAATEGKALGHSCDTWKEVSDSVMSSVCTVCQKTVEEDMDREVLGVQAILGKWTLIAYQVQEEDARWTACRDKDVWVEVFENGKVTTRISKEEHASYEFSSYNEQFNNYWFNITFSDGYCDFRIDPEDGDLYWVADKIWFAFEKASD